MARAETKPFTVYPSKELSEQFEKLSGNKSAKAVELIERWVKRQLKSEQNN